MRTDNPLPPPSTFGRLRAQLGRARRWIGEQAASTRWALAITGLAALIVAGYLSLGSAHVDYEWIDHGYHFLSDDVLKITRTLTAKGIPTEVEDGRIRVPHDQLAAAQAAVAKVDTGIHSYKGIRDELTKGGIFEPPSELEERRSRNRERALEAAIQAADPDGTLSAVVTLRRMPSRGFKAAENLQVVVYLQTLDNRSIPPRIISAIQNLLWLEPDIKPDAVTIIDRRGNIYLKSGDPSFVMRSHTRVREEELTDEIAKQLRWIEGVQVSVKLNSPPTVPPPAVAPNAPLALDEETGNETGKPRILIHVPIAHYKQEFRETGANREPSRNDLMPYVTKTEATIRSAVAHVVPEAEIEELKIDNIDTPSRVVASASREETRRAMPWWAPVAAAVAVVVLVMVGGGLIVARRPAARPARWSRREGYDLSEASTAGPGPSERVRDLVRLSPEAAAGVLERWIGQGGHTA